MLELGFGLRSRGVGVDLASFFGFCLVYRFVLCTSIKLVNN